VAKSDVLQTPGVTGVRVPTCRRIDRQPEIIAWLRGNGLPFLVVDDRNAVEFAI
jgi:hypothetical protein